MDKRPFVICFVAILSVFMLFSYASSQGIRKKLACFPFTPKTLRAISETENLMSTLQNDLDRSGFFELTERKKIENIMDLENMRPEDRSKSTFLSIGNKYGLDFILSGSIDTTDAGIVLELELFDIKGKTSCLSDIYNVSERDASGKKIQDIAGIIIKKAKECSGAGSAAAAQPLTPPVNIETTGSTDAIRIKWGHQRPDMILGYKVYKSAKEEGPFNQIATTTTTFFMDRNLKLNETFYYKIKAISQTGAESEFSTMAVGRTSVAPYPPIFLNIKPDIKSAHLKWLPKPHGEKEKGLEVAGFKIYRKKQGEKDYTEAARLSNEAKVFTDKGLSDGTEYEYAITAFNENKSESHFSARLSATTVAKMKPIKASNGKIRHAILAWEPIISDVVEGYRIYRSLDKYGSYRRITQISNRETTTYTDKDLEDNKEYWYRIAAYNSSNMETDLSEPTSAKTRDRPPVPKGLKARATEPKKVVLQWDLIVSPDDEIKGYKIYRSSTESGEYKLINDVRSDRDQYIDDDFSIKENTVFYYRVSSFNSANAESQLSSPVSVQAIAEPKK